MRFTCSHFLNSSVVTCPVMLCPYVAQRQEHVPKSLRSSESLILIVSRKVSIIVYFTCHIKFVVRDLQS